jgi:hypothetical protein
MPVTSAPFTMTPVAAPGDPFVVIAGITVPIMEGQAAEQPERGGSSDRAFAGNLITDRPWEKKAWQVTTGLLTNAESNALKAVIAFGAHVLVTGIMALSVTAEVTWTSGAYISTSTDDGTGVLRSLVLTIREV